MTVVSKRRLTHFTPLRYPGGKAKLAPFVKAVLIENNIEDGVYIEPFAGGAGIALQLLLQGYVSRIAINDLSYPIFCFWKAVIEDADRLCHFIQNVPLTVQEWDEQKLLLKDRDASPFQIGCAAFYLNRTNRSGVLSGGIIGGRDQSGEWLIDARFNRDELAYRVERISRESDNIDLTNMDCLEFLEKCTVEYSQSKSLIYADPPYYVKGRQLYLDYFRHEDHERLANLIVGKLRNHLWMVSYDDVPEVRTFYADQALNSYSLPYSVRSSTMGTEVMFYSDRLALPFDTDNKSIGPADRFAA